jgi:alkylhydroperoxidase/carboxymuconolactone decarboxylase family protein YurZ
VDATGADAKGAAPRHAAALTSGDLSREEMGEFAAHFAHYAGFPIATQLYTTFQRIAAELDAAEAG